MVGASITLALTGWLMTAAFAAEPVWPSAHWAKADDLTALGWSTEKLSKAKEYTDGYASTAVLIIQDGTVIASWGDIAHKVNVRSVRKSLLCSLFGIGVAEGRIRLGETIGELGIDDRPPGLTEIEKQATIRDLLMSRSGVYHAAAYEAPDAKAKRPPRGSHPPGTFWYYNNWDSTRSASSTRSWSTITSFTRLRSGLPNPSAWRTSHQMTESLSSRPRPIIQPIHFD